MAKLKERQFYNVGSRKTEIVPEQYIKVVKFKNGTYALLGVSKKDENMFKIFSQDKLDKMEKKYGKSKKYKQ